MGTETQPARRRGAHLVEPLHDHVGEVLVQHGRRDDHLVEGLVIAPDGKVRGLLLLAAAEGHRGQREAGGWGAAWPWSAGPWPCSLPWLGGGGGALEMPCPAGPAGLCPRAPCFCFTSALATSPPQPGTFMPRGAGKPDLELSPARGLGRTCSTPGRVLAPKPFVEEAAQPSESSGRGGEGVRWERSPYPPSPGLSPAPASCLPAHPSRDAK